MPTLRRARGAFLRLALARPAAAAIGGVLAAGSAALLLFDLAWESWFTDGLGLILGATGIALLVAAFGGRRPDWIDPTHDRRE